MAGVAYLTGQPAATCNGTQLATTTIPKWLPKPHPEDLFDVLLLDVHGLVDLLLQLIDALMCGLLGWAVGVVMRPHLLKAQVTWYKYSNTYSQGHAVA
jgi:hypothetical protein